MEESIEKTHLEWGKNSIKAMGLKHFIKDCENIELTDASVTAFQKYYCYVEALTLDHEKWARQIGLNVDQAFGKMDEAWYQKGIWPQDVIGPFVRWKDRELPRKYTDKDVRNILESHKDTPEQILVSVQLCLNYWVDAYQLCFDLQSQEATSELGARMEMELFFWKAKMYFY
ncbi:MAG: hypothetical protein HWD61_12410 [Parachlamydiaceae bacterium]|nr:MAG: hypothetical protein HWD61_12410 [Parachlamydiaceae bacterium]